jgi:hypothetical protein
MNSMLPKRSTSQRRASAINSPCSLKAARKSSCAMMGALPPAPPWAMSYGTSVPGSVTPIGSSHLGSWAIAPSIAVSAGARRFSTLRM